MMNTPAANTVGRHPNAPIANTTTIARMIHAGASKVDSKNEAT